MVDSSVHAQKERCNADDCALKQNGRKNQAYTMRRPTPFGELSDIRRRKFCNAVVDVNQNMIRDLSRK
jgi:hypothetical protein